MTVPCADIKEVTNKNSKASTPEYDVSGVLALRENATPHTDLRTREALATMGWIVLPHPPYIPDLASTDFHVSGPLKHTF